jgi:hypothetical protein
MSRKLAWTMIYGSILALTLTAPALAQAPASDPLFSLKRLSVAAGIEKEVLRDYATDQESWAAVLPIAYNVLSPAPGAQGIRLSLTARAVQSFDTNAKPELWLGARVTLWRGAK